MSWGSRRTAVNRLTKPPSNDHSCCNLARTDAKSCGLHATESSPYKVNDDRVLYARVRLVWVVVASSFSGEPVVPSAWAGSPSDTLEQFTRLNWEQGGFVALRVALVSMNKPYLYASLSEIRFVDTVAIGITGGECLSSISSEGFVIWCPESQSAQGHHADKYIYPLGFR